jgi:hypothetical protein
MGIPGHSGQTHSLRPSDYLRSERLRKTLRYASMTYLVLSFPKGDGPHVVGWTWEGRAQGVGARGNRPYGLKFALKGMFFTGLLESFDETTSVASRLPSSDG